MKNTLRSKEAHVLDRVMYLLEEYSVQYLAEEDDTFAAYVDSLYAQIDAKSTQLRKLVT